MAAPSAPSAAAAGSLIGGLYAAGVSVEAMDAKVREFAHKPVRPQRLGQTALLGTSVGEHHSDLVGDPNLDTLPIPFATTATLITPARASPSGRLLVDAILTNCAIQECFPSGSKLVIRSGWSRREARSIEAARRFCPPRRCGGIEPPAGRNGAHRTPGSAGPGTQAPRLPMSTAASSRPKRPCALSIDDG